MARSLVLIEVLCGSDGAQREVSCPHDRPSKRVNLPGEIQHLSPAATRALFQRELAYYRADMAYLPVQKAAERCLKLSVLLTAAGTGRFFAQYPAAVAVDNAVSRTLH